jgi:hypothetical protein
MRRKLVRSALLSLLLLVAAIVAPAASAKELQANVVSMPSGLVAGETAPIVFEVYVLEEITGGQDIEHPVDVGGASVVLSSADDSLERRVFRAKALGEGRYRSEIVFPAVGGWNMDVTTNDGHEPFALGKGSVTVTRGVAADAPDAATPAAETATSGFPLGLGLAGGALVLAAGALGVRRRWLRPRR